ncbi:predicted protein [Uncinocarpus reesii 1704]|uniref:Uncharacterized protein n=1 Tax=Uncinocarpus reesii (strain UAMH 1704) TaxID=336963 RepID=C4JIF4_UNCRE|nr:uncharacterized protein UREG_01491 [Uncinocarpus reesii 1704]EEP76642.1 predicted protein [Uncinocarpus reesii 1704]
MGFSKISSKISHKFVNKRKNSSSKKGKKTAFRATLPDIQEQQEPGSTGSATITPSTTFKWIEEDERAKMPPLITDDNSEARSESMASSETSATVVSKCPAAAPIKRSHLLCFTAHSTFTRCRNTHHSLPCMTCKRGGFPHLYKCTFCSLRVCRECMGTLNGFPGHSLQMLLQYLGVEVNCH